MDSSLIPAFADSLKAYYSNEELQELAEMFGTELEYDGYGVSHLRLAKKLILNSELGNNRRFLETVIPNLLSRCEDSIAHTDFERRAYHYGMRPHIEGLVKALGTDGLPSEVAVPAKNPFTAKAEVRELLAGAETEVFLVDNYIGIGTLDCLRLVGQPLRILTGDKPASIETGFDTALKEFRAEGRTIKVCRHSKLHDRYLIFNERCWLIGSSLKDAGEKTFSVVECVDTYPTIRGDTESKWLEATEFVV
jgi:hypothetical protein